MAAHACLTLLVTTRNKHRDAYLHVHSEYQISFAYRFTTILQLETKKFDEQNKKIRENKCSNILTSWFRDRLNLLASKNIMN